MQSYCPTTTTTIPTTATATTTTPTTIPTTTTPATASPDTTPYPQCVFYVYNLELCPSNFFLAKH